MKLPLNYLILLGLILAQNSIISASNLADRSTKIKQMQLVKSISQGSRDFNVSIVSDVPEHKEAHSDFRPATTIPLEDAWASPARKLQNMDVNVSGKITDEDGEVLVGVNVLINGTIKGTNTDFDGKYSLNNVSDDAILVFSHIGYKTQEIPVNGRSSVDVTMISDAQLLDEMVVVGYGTTKKKNILGSITTVSYEELSVSPVSRLSNTLAGRVPGATILQNSGWSGSSSSILIRGKGTWNNASPLFVIDGIIRDQASFDALSANEVESITFLKDAASASVYGSRAANGVVLLTTRKGKNQKPVFTLNSSISTQRPTKPIQGQTTAIQELEYRNNVAETYGQPIPHPQSHFDYFKDKNYQLLDYIYENPQILDLSLSVNGGTESLSYFMSGGFNRNDFAFANTGYNRYNFISNVTAEINDYLSVNVNIKGNQQEERKFNAPFEIGDYTMSGSTGSIIQNSKLYPFYVDENGNPSNEVTDYPVQAQPQSTNNSGMSNGLRRNFSGTLSLNLKIPFIDGLSTKLVADYAFGDYNSKYVLKHIEYYDFQSASADNPYIPAPVDPNKKSVFNFVSPYEYIGEEVNLFASSQINWFLNYDKAFGRHNISGTLVYEQQQNKLKTLYGKAEDLISSDVDQLVSASRSTDRRWFDGNESGIGRMSWIGRLNYGFADKYFLELSGRYDGSYIFPEDTRMGFFPSGSLGWIISNEDFFNYENFNLLKIRMSVGTAGNDNVSPYQWQYNYSLGNTYVFGNSVQTGITAGAPPNPYITWEKSITYNSGFDIGLFNKLTMSADFFYRYTYDILAPRIKVIPSTYGAGLSAENYGEMNVKGFEISLDYRNKIGEFGYSIGANMGYAKDNVIYVDEPAGLEDWRSAIGQPLNRIWGFKDHGLIRDEATLNAIPDDYRVFGNKPMLGTILFEDIRGQNRSPEPDGIIDFNDQTWLSTNAIPRINYGINLGFEWKNITASILFQGVGAYDKMVQSNFTGGVFQVGAYPYFDLWTEAWTPEKPNNPYPRAGNWGPAELGYESSQFWMRNGAYMRLKDLNIAYTIPQIWTRKILMDKASVFFNATNLFVISEFKEHDPEQAYLNSFNLMKTFTFGLSVNF